MYFRNILILFSVCSIYGVFSNSTSDDLRVTLSYGSKLIGRYLRSHNGRPIKGFTNIPYAKAPIANLRFKAPEPIEKWDGEYKAINDGPMCAQQHLVTQLKYIGVEDCLRLNVYVPQMFHERQSNLPVLVHLHGGGYQFGSGIKSSNGPEYFLDHNVILVSANYRLGLLGFLSTEDENCPGNFGLKDQVLVLKWIRSNIKLFGGDAANVTIFGGSAGAASVTFLMASPLAKGLFSKAIAQSGTNLAPWALARKGRARTRAIQLAEHLNCYNPNNWPATIDCLRNVPPENITAFTAYCFEFNENSTAFPVIEPDLEGDFLTDHPCDLISKTSLDVPFLTGMNHDEGLVVLDLFNMPGSFDNFATNLDRILSAMIFHKHNNSSVQTNLTNQIKEYYFKNDLKRDKGVNLTNLFSDGLFLSPMNSYLRLRLMGEEVSSTFVYLFAHKATASSRRGVSHAEEMKYLFPLNESVSSHTTPTIEDEEIRRAMIQMWVDFACTGNPTPESSYLPKWQKLTGIPLNYYRIGNFHFEDKPLFGMEYGGLFEDRSTFWRKIEAHSLAYQLDRDEL